MTNSVTNHKLDFLTYLLQHKHGILYDKYTFLTEYLWQLPIVLESKQNIWNIINHCDGEMTRDKDEVLKWVTEMKDEFTDVLSRDILFCLISADAICWEVYQDKKVDIENVRHTIKQAYKDNLIWYQKFCKIEMNKIYSSVEEGGYQIIRSYNGITISRTRKHEDECTITQSCDNRNECVTISGDNRNECVTDSDNRNDYATDSDNRNDGTASDNINEYDTASDNLPTTNDNTTSTQTKKANNKKKVDNTQTKNKKDTKPENTRFAPEPAGCLHIGHVKALMVNYNMAKCSGGKFILRFDDTNPVKDYHVFEKEILKDLEVLGIQYDTVTHSSDYFDLLVEKAIFLINKNLAYCDNTEQEQMRSERMDGIESKCRSNSIQENICLFNDMLAGVKNGYCLRAKINMTNPNKTMRDPVIYRMTDKLHQRCPKYHACPTYDFVCPILDSVENVTTACRANEYRDRNEQYKWFIKYLELQNKPRLFDFSKLNFENTVLSKRKIECLISENKVCGWDDPRLCTIRGIQRAGMDLEALKQYINLQGASHKTNTISWDKVWAMNKKAIDHKSGRFMAVQKEGCVLVHINCITEKIPFTKRTTLHKKNDTLGMKDKVYDNTIYISQDDAQVLSPDLEFTLMDWGNAIVRSKEDNVIHVDLHLQGDYKKTKYKISWVSVIGSILVRVYEYNIDMDSDNKKETLYYVENSIAIVQEGQHVQFERIGFMYCDGMYTYNMVPYTKQKRT